MSKDSLASRLWQVLLHGIAIVAAISIGWRAFGPPASPEAGPANIVAIKESAEPAAADRSAGEAGSYRAAARKASGSVVNVYTLKALSRRPDGWRRPYEEPETDPPQGQSSLGSGVIVSAQGHILTNNHVVEGADQIAVMLPNGKVADARVIGTDPESDLAVLQITATGLQPVVFANPASVQVGDVVLAIGDPFGVGTTVTQGIVSATGRNRLGINTFENFIQTDAAINPGNSGGALVNTAGQLVGINTAIYSRSGGSQGIGFAIPVSLARQVMEQIIATGRVSRGWLGVSARDVLDEKKGVKAGAELVGLLRGGPAEKAGLRPADTIVAVNGKEIADTAALIAETAALAPGSRTSLQVMREGKPYSIEVVLGQRPIGRRP